jgi:hypothetical protein
MSLGQGIIMILAGAAAERYAPSRVIAICGATGALIAVAIAVNWARSRNRQ